jgi:hypothetical protein
MNGNFIRQCLKSQVQYFTLIPPARLSCGGTCLRIAVTEAITVIQVPGRRKGASCRRPSQLSQCAARPAAPRTAARESRHSRAVRTSLARPRAARAETAGCRQPGRNRPPPIFCRARLRRRSTVPAWPRAIPCPTRHDRANDFAGAKFPKYF